jgi:tetratricopeptide (TPR) repeat protein
VPRQSTTHVDNADGVAARLRAARRDAGLSQTELAFPGCSSGYISRLEAGERTPSLQVVRELARRLGVSEDWLAHGDDRCDSESAAALLRDADIALRLDDVATARELFERVLSDAAEAAQRARAHGGLGQIAFREGDARGAIELIEPALDAELERSEASLVDTLARAYARVGETEEAIALLRRALGRAEAVNDPLDRLRFGVLLANAYIDESRFHEATDLLAALLSELGELDSLSRARIYWSQSRLHTMRNETESAARFARRALDLLEATEHTYYYARAHLLIAFAELDSGHPQEALDLLRRGRALLGDQANPHDLAKVDIEEARALAKLGQFEEAGSLALAAAAAFRDSHPHEAGRSFGELAAIFEELGERARARELYELAVEILEQEPNRFLAEVYVRFGDLLEAEGCESEALAVFRKGSRLQAQLQRAPNR